MRTAKSEADLCDSVMLCDRIDMNSTAAQQSITPSPTFAPSPRGAFVFKTALGVFLVLIGTVATAALWIAYQRAAETRQWTPVSCVIIGSQLLTERETPHSPVSFRADVRYRYRLNDKAYTGTRIRRTEGPSTDRTKVEKILKAHPLGATTECYVEPGRDDFAILEHSSIAPIYSIWFPLLFVIGGCGMIVAAFREWLKPA